MTVTPITIPYKTASSQPGLNHSAKTATTQPGPPLLRQDPLSQEYHHTGKFATTQGHHRARTVTTQWQHSAKTSITQCAKLITVTRIILVLIYRVENCVMTKWVMGKHGYCWEEMANRVVRRLKLLSITAAPVLLDLEFARRLLLKEVSEWWLMRRVRVQCLWGY